MPDWLNPEKQNIKRARCGQPSGVRRAPAFLLRISGYSGDLPQWVIREGMTNAGYYQGAKSTEEFCRNVFSELQAAFKNGTLVKKDALYLSNQIRGISLSEIPGFLRMTLRDLYYMLDLRYAGIHYPTPASGEKEQIKVMQEVTGEYALTEELLSNEGIKTVK